MKKMMKMAALAAACVMSVCAKAQDVQMVTLQHGEQMTVYYGPGSFRQAMVAANQGDLISLSAGVFEAADVKKAVTIQGAGYVQDTANGRFRTAFDGSFAIDIPAGQTGLCIEGIYTDAYIYFDSDVEQFEIKKSYIRELSFTYNSKKGTNGLVDQCRLKYFPIGHSENILVKNSIIFSLSASDDASLSVQNCIISSIGGAGEYKNSIIRWPNGGTAFYNNVTQGHIDSPVQDGNTVIEDHDYFNSLFTDPNKVNSFDNDSYDYHLTSTAASQYKGTDGTEVGIYGGSTPFTDIPSNPQITHKEVAPQSGNDGKLSVKFTIEAQQ